MISITENTIPLITEKFLDFSKKSHAIGSNAPTSYVRALEILDKCLKKHKIFSPDQNIWVINDIKYLEKIYDFVKAEQKKSDGGIFNGEKYSSYWAGGFCSAAIKDFSRFLILGKRQEKMLDAFNTINDGNSLAQKLAKIALHKSTMLLDDDNVRISSLEGKTKICEVKVRQNQNIFRQMVLENYGSQCCLTGLPIPEVLRASHISAWADDKPNRLNPENGLCLSATYDAAFDRHLISFDEDYKLIFSSALKEYYTNDAFKKYFLNLKGRKISLPQRFMPSQCLLEKHRCKLITK